ncbi:YfbU family protein [Pseudomonas aeruginosa]|uniref:YfbU family protein n=1 Tax=Pseudomonas aeruginosa TaxID=287 RepID=UPI0014740633|nr:YfbU family protein [Pseudomonas aeruginosa]NNB82430.1 hypothetical protein [Pseudomonas aeruginosa]HCD7565642.1 YfbU family protein [Pseudomonas aeruginosa]HCZ9127931.1 YfbU family protein [Pseudomonas aeruginosa]
MASERFEMRIDSDLLERLDQWRQGEDDTPSRAEAVRRLIEAGLAHDNKGRAPHLSDGEKLIAMMLAELIKKTGVDVDTNVDLVEKVILGGHYWALGWEMPGIFHGHADKQSRVRFVVDVLDMWSFMEEAFDELGEESKARLAKEADPFGKHVQFLGFDGNNESEHLGIARFLINDLDRFSRFREGHRDLNSHCPTIESYGRMLRVFEPIRQTLVGRRLNVDELAAILNSRRAS